MQKGWVMKDCRKHIKTVIVEDHALTRIVLKQMCESYSNISVCADFDNAEDALVYVIENSVDLVILDMWLSKMNGIEASKYLKNKFPNLKVIMLVSNIEKQEVLASAFSSADAFMLRDTDLYRLSKIIGKIFEGKFWFDYRIIHSVFNWANLLPKSEYSLFYNLLTELEADIISKVIKGVEKEEIALHLNVEKDEFSFAINSIFNKLAKTDTAKQMLRRIRYDLF